MDVYDRGAMEPTELASWLLAPATRALDDGALLDGLAQQLIARGVGLWRVVTSVHTKHPEVYVRNVHWSPESGSVVQFRPRDVLELPMFRDSPVAAIYGGAPRIRCRLVGVDADLRYPVCRDLADAGATDYVALPLPFGDGQRSYISFATKQPGGFSDADLAVFQTAVDPMAMHLELRTAQYTTRSLLDVYLGHNAAERVLAGAFRRGTGVSIRAAIWFCDMRGFTTMADRAQPAEVVATLDRFFEAIAGPIALHGGEVLKFIGDAVLAIFPVEQSDPSTVCQRALDAASAAMRGIAALNAERLGAVPLELGIALQLGDVMYGNIGARDRLDFTVIGAAVNEVCRVEALCKSLGTSVLATSVFADACPEAPWVRLGKHALKGVSEPQDIATLREFTAAETRT